VIVVDVRPPPTSTNQSHFSGMARPQATTSQALVKLIPTQATPAAKFSRGWPRVCKRAACDWVLGQSVTWWNRDELRACDTQAYIVCIAGPCNSLCFERVNNVATIDLFLLLLGRLATHRGTAPPHPSVPTHTLSVELGHTHVWG
jgi:hypothetical protein